VNFLADESCDAAIVRGLRGDGHDVLAVADVIPGALDPAVIQLAVSQQRVLLTEDKDFGQLVFAGRSRRRTSNPGFRIVLSHPRGTYVNPPKI
jgi:predicted nuclease of predicted toxin-antitoxin system